MAESPSRDSTPGNSDLIITDPVQQHQQQYWCHHCDKRVSVETGANLPDIICFECKNGFVESIAFTSNHHLSRSTPPTIASPSDFVDEPSFGSQFLQVLRLIAQASREEDAAADAPPPPPPDAAHLEGDDFLRIELDGWDNVEDDEEDEFGAAVEVEHDEEDEDLEHEEEDEEQDNDEDGEEERSDEENEQNLNNNNEETDEDEDEEDRRRRRRDAARLRIRDIAARARTGHNRFLDWANLRYNGYVGNPDDYVDAAGYEALLQNLADSDQNGRRGPPPAAKSAISALPDWTISLKDESMQCAICKDVANVGDTVKKLPCGHGYHGDCIVPWLGSRNSCPVCRFELPTDDHEYEMEKQKKADIPNSASEASGSG